MGGGGVAGGRVGAAAGRRRRGVKGRFGGQVGGGFAAKMAASEALSLRPLPPFPSHVKSRNGERYDPSAVHRPPSSPFVPPLSLSPNSSPPPSSPSCPPSLSRRPLPFPPIAAAPPLPNRLLASPLLSDKRTGRQRGRFRTIPRQSFCLGDQKASRAPPRRAAKKCRDVIA